MSELLPQEQAKEVVSMARDHINRMEKNISTLLKNGALALRPSYDQGKFLSDADKQQIKSWKNEISETKNAAKKEIDKLTLPEKEKEKYKDLIDGKTDKEKAEQKGFFEKDNYLTKGFNEKANSQPRSKYKDDLER